MREQLFQFSFGKCFSVPSCYNDAMCSFLNTN